MACVRLPRVRFSGQATHTPPLSSRHMVCVYPSALLLSVVWSQALHSGSR